VIVKKKKMKSVAQFAKGVAFFEEKKTFRLAVNMHIMSMKQK